MSKHYVYVTGTGLEFSKGEPIPNPRTEYPQLAVIYYNHQRRVLGDKKVSGDLYDCMVELIEEYEPGFDERLDFKFGDYLPNNDERHAQAERCRAYIEEHFDSHYLWLPVYVLEHSGIALNTTGFNDWDSGMVGVIVVSKEKAREEYGWKRLTKSRIEIVMERLKGEVKEYSQYLEGDVYGFRVLEAPDHIIEEEEMDDPDYDLQEMVEFLDLSECTEVELLYGFYSKEECEAQAKDCLKTWEETHYARVAREAGQLDLPLAA
jgi:hypothetical protein